MANKIKIDDLTIYSKSHDDKTKKSILLIHGLWHGAWYWENLMEFYFNKGYNCFAIDLPNHGKSKINKNFRFTTTNDHITAIKLVIDKLKIKPILIGHSMGSLVVTRFTNKYPESISKLILISPSYRGSIMTATLKTLINFPFAFLKANLFFHMYPIIAKPNQVRKLITLDSISDDELNELCPKLEDDSYITFVELLTRGLKRKYKDGPSILVMSGGKDFIISEGAARKAAKNLDAKLIIYPNNSHNLIVETGWKTRADELLQWIEA
ncbi:MAG: lysophospholipase [Candidatus Heimdallarchaeota archaeon]|nr:lysophospholipase [Candidatus Heimdallarchaeota archaeon]